MKKPVFRIVKAPTLFLAAAGLLWIGTPVRAQTSQVDSPVQQSTDSRRDQPAQFDRFLDNHPEIAEQVRKDPSLTDSPKFVKDHPALQKFLQDNPDIRAQLRQDPKAFLHQEDRFDRNAQARDSQDIDRRDVTGFDRFLDTHREIAD